MKGTLSFTNMTIMRGERELESKASGKHDRNIHHYIEIPIFDKISQSSSQKSH